MCYDIEMIQYMSFLAYVFSFPYSDFFAPLPLRVTAFPCPSHKSLQQASQSQTLLQTVINVLISCVIKLSSEKLNNTCKITRLEGLEHRFVLLQKHVLSNRSRFLLVRLRYQMLCHSLATWTSLRRTLSSTLCNKCVTWSYISYFPLVESNYKCGTHTFLCDNSVFAFGYLSE